MSQVVTLLGWRITFLGTSVTPQGNSIWQYFVDVDPDNPPTRGLSHLSIALCDDPQQQVVPNSVTINGQEWDEYEVLQGDPTIPDMAGVYLIKIDSLGLEPDEAPITISFTLVGSWQIGPVLVGVKAATFVETGIIYGPSCTARIPPNCDCDVELDALPTCNSPIMSILCAVAHEQAEMARMLKVLRCKLCHTVSWLPEEFVTTAESIDAAVAIESDVADLIRAMAAKENAIANKVQATKGCQKW